MQAMIPMDERDAHLEALAAQLNASGNYRVLRRLLPRTVVTAADGTPTRTGLFIDVETTGLDHQKDEVIELAMVPFTYSLDGRSEEHTSELQSLMRISYAVFCLKKKKKNNQNTTQHKYNTRGDT